MENLTHWKKNNDSRYISGEDLRAGLKGLKPEMNVVITHFEDSETFDQKTQEKVIKSGLFLQELDGTKVYKPVILNNTNAKFFIREFQSEFMEHWLNKPCTLYAQPDKRHGFVARFKRYFAPNTATFEKQLNDCKTLAELTQVWTAIPSDIKKIKAVFDIKETLKTTLK
jgi:hypothetical protein